MHKFQKTFIPFIVATWYLLCTNALHAQQGTFCGIDMAGGLSDLLVNAIYKDKDGFVWIGTDNSLDRFDGITIKNFPYPNTYSTGKRVQAIAENGKFIYSGNQIGLWQLDKTTEQQQRLFPENIHCAVHALHFDHDKLYIGTEQGLFVHDGTNLTQITVSKNMFSRANCIMGICPDSTGILWLASSEGLHAYSKSSITSYYFDVSGKAAANHMANSAAGYNNFRNVVRMGNTLYLGTWTNGLVMFDIKAKTFARSVNVGNNIISALSTDDNGHVAIGTDGNGVHILQHSTQRIITSYKHNPQNKNTIRSNSVYSLFIDRDGIMWIGFYQAGIDYQLYQSGLFCLYEFPPIFTSKDLQVRSFLIDGHRKLIGTRNGLFCIDESKRTLHRFDEHQLRSDMIFSLVAYGKYYYVGTYGGGLSVIDRTTMQVHPFEPDKADAVFSNGHIFAIRPDERGNLWFATSAGAYKYTLQTGEVVCYNSRNSQVPEGIVYEIFFDSTGKGWICTEGGLCLYDPTSGSIKRNAFPEGFIQSEKIRMMYEDSRHNLHFLPDKGERFTSDLGMTHFFRSPMAATMHGNSCQSIVEDLSGRLWFGCDNGLFRTNADNTHTTIYGFSDGLPDNVFTSRSAFCDSTGTLWFGNAKGLIYVRPERADSICYHPYSIALTDLRINGEPLATELRKAFSQRHVKLKHHQNNLIIAFTDLTYTDHSALAFEYQLDGAEKEWTLVSGQNTASFFNLSAGNYTFRVRLPGDEQSEVSLRLSIAPLLPWWAWLLLATVVIVGVVALWNHRPTKQQQEHEDEPKYKTNRLPADKCKALYAQLQKHMETAKPYVNPDMKIQDLANDLHTSSPSLSYLFNQYLNESYYDFVNEYRVEEFKRLVKSADASRFTLSALAEQSGFSSRTSFFRSFKKVTGITPNEYIRQTGSAVATDEAGKA